MNPKRFVAVILWFAGAGISASHKHAAAVASARYPNSHHVLIMLSSRNISGVLDSTVSATKAEINRLEKRNVRLEKRNVREECYHLHRLAASLQVASTARCLVCPEPRSSYHYCLGRRSDLEDMAPAGKGV